MDVNFSKEMEVKIFSIGNILEGNIYCGNKSD